MSQLLSSLPVGTLVKDTNTKYNDETIVWQILEHGHSGDPAGSTTLQSKDLVTLKCFDAKEPSNSNSNRKASGNNRYLYSNLLQWLNSDQTNWYTAKHSTDQKPDSDNVWQTTAQVSGSSIAINPYDTEAGFLTYFSNKLKSQLQNVSKVTSLNMSTDGGGGHATETVTSKIFLLSATEVGLSSVDTVEGSLYLYYQSNKKGKYVANSKTKGNYIYEKHWGDESGEQTWWLRTPNYSTAHTVRLSSGTYLDAFNGSAGVAPAFAIPSTILVSDNPDTDGAYIMDWNTAPTISPSTQSFGNVNVPPTLSLTIDDVDNDSVSGIVYLDGLQQNTFSITGSGNYSIPFSTWWEDIGLGDHTVTVSVSDSSGATASGVYTFKRVNTNPVITPSTQQFNTISVAPTLTLSIEDINGDYFSGVVSLDNVQKDTFDATGNTSYSIPFSTWWDNVSAGEHTVTVVVTDDYNGTTTGTYTFTKANSVPIVTTESTSLGNKNAAFSLDFIVTDADMDSVDVTIKIDNTIVKTESNIQLGSPIALNITSEVIRGLSDGNHTITIIANDGHGSSDPLVISFSKSTPYISNIEVPNGLYKLRSDVNFTVNSNGFIVFS